MHFKVQVALALFSIEKACALHLTSFLLPPYFYRQAMSQSAQGILTVIVKSSLCVCTLFDAFNLFFRGKPP